ncbi:LacI family DNA-binding transcriptional regulator [Candidatus Clostridium stratigraminis]|uniref:LacI family DNA-binding transcriptional regulator n=1 Tax=Candidatus Clostridium stratigraminis TaxID=3381661 RepID=A0ABW8T6C9_9CLOT
MAATIKDVAKAASVSVSTVSLVINNSNLVKLETRYKVLQAIKELNYKPNEYARSLVTKTKKVIGVAWPTTISSTILFSFEGHTDTYLSELLPSIEKEINKSNYSMMLEHFRINDPSTFLPSIMDNTKVDGMLVTGGIVSDEVLQRIQEVKIPTVLVGSRHNNLDYVDTDPELGMYKSTKYLIEMGHKDIAFINGPDESQSSARKLSGFYRAMKEHDLPINDKWITKAEYSGAAAYRAMSDLWDMNIRPTAIIGGFDCITIGALRFLYEKGLNCPNDVSAIGFEDSILAEYSYPPLTTVRIHKEQIGIESCKILLNRINKPTAKKVKLIIEPELILRGSVKHL